MKVVRSLLGVGIGLVLTVCFFGLVIAAAGAGHGTYLPAHLLFPFAMIAASAHQTISAGEVVLAGLQFPLYGGLLGGVYGSVWFERSLLVIGVVHLIAAGISIASGGDAFS